MARLIDKTPRVLFGIDYHRSKPLDLVFRQGYEILGIDRRNEQLSLYKKDESFTPYACIIPHERCLYVGDISISSFDPNKEEYKGIMLRKKRFLRFFPIKCQEPPVIARQFLRLARYRLVA